MDDLSITHEILTTINNPLLLALMHDRSLVRSGTAHFVVIRHRDCLVARWGPTYLTAEGVTACLGLWYRCKT
jgi:hypothetical protein